MVAFFFFLFLFTIESNKALNYSCFDKGCSTRVLKAYATIQIGIMDSKSLACLIEVHGDSATRNEKEGKRVFVLFPFTRLRHLEVQSSHS